MGSILSSRHRTTETSVTSNNVNNSDSSAGRTNRRRVAPDSNISQTIALGQFDKYKEFGLDLQHSSHQLLIEHYQPASFPLVAVIATSTNRIVNDSWDLIRKREYEDAEAKDGKVSGSVYFYNVFFRMLFERCADLQVKFPTIFLQATVMSKVIGLCLSIEYGKIDMQLEKIKDLGRKHRAIVHDPWHFSIYAETLHSTFKLALKDDATPQVMEAWANVLAFILRFMLPEAITPDHVRPYACALNAESAINARDQENIKSIKDQNENRSDLLRLAKTLRVQQDRSTLAPHAEVLFQESALGDDNNNEMDEEKDREAKDRRKANVVPSLLKKGKMYNNHVPDSSSMTVTPTPENRGL